MSYVRALHIALVAVVALSPVAEVSAQQSDYVIGPGDVLSVSVWRHPDLDRDVVVRSTGTVTFPPIGEINAAGLTPAQLSRAIMQRLRDYTRETTQVTVSMAQFNSRAVYLTGQVMVPGRYSFERIPDLLQVLSQAGGPLPGADLSNVTIVRPSAGGPRVISVDLSSYMTGTATEPLPGLQPGDTVDVPSLALSAGATSGGGLVYILGEVTTPGAYPLAAGMDLLQLIALAGGTTAEAELDQVAVVIDNGVSQSVASIDLERVIAQGTPSPFRLSPGDRVVIPGQEADALAQALGVTSTVLGYGRDILTSWLLYLSVERELDDREARAAAQSAATSATTTTTTTP